MHSAQSETERAADELASIRVRLIAAADSELAPAELYWRVMELAFTLRSWLDTHDSDWSAL